MAVFNIGISKVIYQKEHGGQTLALVQLSTKTMWAIYLIQDGKIQMSRCYCWFSDTKDKTKKLVQAGARRDYKKYKQLFLTDKLEWI